MRHLSHRDIDQLSDYERGWYEDQAQEEYKDRQLNRD